MDKIRLLYIEDNEEFAVLIKDHLDQQGFDTAIAYTAHKALKLFNEFHPALVIIDLDLDKEKEGLEVIRTLHSQQPLFPIIVYSAHVDSKTVITTMELGVLHHIGKDRPLPEFVAMIRNALQQSYYRRQNQNPIYQLSDITAFNIITNTIKIGDNTYDLKKIAGNLLKQLCLHINEFVSPEELSIAIWGIEKPSKELRRYITALREVIEKNDPEIKLLNKIGGFYQIECEKWKR